MLDSLARKRVKVREVSNMGLTIPTVHYARLRAAADLRERSVSSLTRLILIEWLEVEDTASAIAEKENSSPARVESKRGRAATKRVIGP